MLSGPPYEIRGPQDVPGVGTQGCAAKGWSAVFCKSLSLGFTKKNRILALLRRPTARHTGYIFLPPFLGTFFQKNYVFSSKPPIVTSMVGGAASHNF